MCERIDFVEEGVGVFVNIKIEVVEVESSKYISQ